MKNISLLTYTFFICCTTCDAQKIKTEYFDKYWRRIDYNIDAEYYRKIQRIKDSSTIKLFLVKDFYKTDTLQMIGTYLDADKKIKHGTFFYYFPNGNKKSETTFINNKKEGKSKLFYESGQIKYLSEFHNDTILSLKGWHEDNTVSELAQFKNGKIDGKYLTFYTNGKLIRFDIYDKGVFTSGKCYTNSGQDTVYFPHKTEPKFPDGYDKFINYLRDGIQSKTVSCGWFKGEIHLQAVVDRNGKLIQPFLEYTSDDCYLKRIYELIENSPNWTPGKIDGVVEEYPIYFSVSFPK
jgi:hypothetical protein